jgi:hypothetical protein
VTTEYPLPDKAAKDPHTINIAPDGTVWFTVQQGNMVGRLDPKSGVIKLVTWPTPIAPLRADDRYERRAVGGRIRRAEDRAYRPADDAI